MKPANFFASNLKNKKTKQKKWIFGFFIPFRLSKLDFFATDRAGLMKKKKWFLDFYWLFVFRLSTLNQLCLKPEKKISDFEILGFPIAFRRICLLELIGPQWVSLGLKKKAHWGLKELIGAKMGSVYKKKKAGGIKNEQWKI